MLIIEIFVDMCPVIKAVFILKLNCEADMEIKEIIEKTPSIYNMLKDCPFEILKKWEIKKYPKDFPICAQGEIYDYFYIIIDGYINIYMTAENGKKYSQAIYKGGDYFGELEIFARLPYICFVETITDSTIMRISREYFLKWLELDRNIINYIMHTLCGQFYNLSKKAGEDTLYSLKHRVCHYLLYYHHEGVDCEDGIRLNISKEQLSEQFAVTQRSINRILQYLKFNNIIEEKNNYIIIKDIKALENEEVMSRFE